MPGFASAGTGTYASTLCWFDLSGYVAAQATSATGQQMSITLPGVTASATDAVKMSAVAKMNAVAKRARKDKAGWNSTRRGAGLFAHRL